MPPQHKNYSRDYNQGERGRERERSYNSRGNYYRGRGDYNSQGRRPDMGNELDFDLKTDGATRTC